MQNQLIDAYCKFFGKEAVGLLAWQIVEQLVEHLDPRVLGMGLSRYILYVACCTDVDYPDEDVKKSIVETARLKACEVFEEHEGTFITLGDIRVYYVDRKHEFMADVEAHLAASPA